MCDPTLWAQNAENHALSAPFPLHPISLDNVLPPLRLDALHLHRLAQDDLSPSRMFDEAAEV